jgi:hypothetical protein
VLRQHRAGSGRNDEGERLAARMWPSVERGKICGIGAALGDVLKKHHQMFFEDPEVTGGRQVDDREKGDDLHHVTEADQRRMIQAWYARKVVAKKRVKEATEVTRVAAVRRYGKGQTQVYQWRNGDPAERVNEKRIGNAVARFFSQWQAEAAERNLFVDTSCGVSAGSRGSGGGGVRIRHDDLRVAACAGSRAAIGTKKGAREPCSIICCETWPQRKKRRGML